MPLITCRFHSHHQQYSTTHEERERERKRPTSHALVLILLTCLLHVCRPGVSSAGSALPRGARQRRRGTATQSRRATRTTRAAGALCMEGPSLIRNYHKMGKRKGAYPASSEAAAAGDPNPTARLVLALLLLLVIIAIAFVVWRRARNRGPHCARRPKPRAWELRTRPPQSKHTRKRMPEASVLMRCARPLQMRSWSRSS